MKERNHLTATFYFKIGLKHHIESVHEGKKIACAVCSSAFSTKQYLNRHMMMLFMKRKKAFACPECPLAFSQKVYLNKHIEIVHKGKKPHVCTVCLAAFSTKVNLKIKNHIEMVHEGKRPMIQKIHEENKPYAYLLLYMFCERRHAVLINTSCIHGGNIP